MQPGGEPVEITRKPEKCLGRLTRAFTNDPRSGDGAIVIRDNARGDRMAPRNEHARPTANRSHNGHCPVALASLRHSSRPSDRQQVNRCERGQSRREPTDDGRRTTDSSCSSTPPQVNPRWTTRREPGGLDLRKPDLLDFTAVPEQVKALRADLDGAEWHFLSVEGADGGQMGRCNEIAEFLRSQHPSVHHGVGSLLTPLLSDPPSLAQLVLLPLVIPAAWIACSWWARRLAYSPMSSAQRSGFSR